MKIVILLLIIRAAFLPINSQHIAGKPLSAWLAACKRNFNKTGKSNPLEVLREDGYCEGVICVDNDNNFGINAQFCEENHDNRVCVKALEPFPNCCNQEICYEYTNHGATQSTITEESEEQDHIVNNYNKETIDPPIHSEENVGTEETQLLTTQKFLDDPKSDTGIDLSTLITTSSPSVTTESSLGNNNNADSKKVNNSTTIQETEALKVENLEKSADVKSENVVGLEKQYSGSDNNSNKITEGNKTITNFVETRGQDKQEPNAIDLKKPQTFKIWNADKEKNIKKEENKIDNRKAIIVTTEPVKSKVHKRMKWIQKCTKNFQLCLSLFLDHALDNDDEATDTFKIPSSRVSKKRGRVLRKKKFKKRNRRRPKRSTDLLAEVDEEEPFSRTPSKEGESPVGYRQLQDEEEEPKELNAVEYRFK